MIRWMVVLGVIVTLSACGEDTKPLREGESNTAAMKEGGKKGKRRDDPPGGVAPIDCAEAWLEYDICRDLAQLACEETIEAFETCVEAHGGGAPIPTPGMDPWDDVVGPEEDELPEECLSLFAEVMACQMACVDEYIAKEEACHMGPDCPGQPGGSWGSGHGSGGAGGWDDPPPTRCDTPEEDRPPSSEGGCTDSDD